MTDANDPRFYIGDIHGCDALLRDLLSYIGHHAEKAGFAPKVTFLGDLVDRGGNSPACIDIVADTLQTWEGSRQILGNHDDMFLRHVRRGMLNGEVTEWLTKNGGIATCNAYGAFLTFENVKAFPEVAQIIRLEHPEHLDQMDNALLHSVDGPFYVCHAGIDPYRPLDFQGRETLMWIRRGFINHVDARMTPVIHGHTIVGDLPAVTENRISIDTGAVKSGRLTCLLIEPEKAAISFYQTNGGKVVSVDPQIVDRRNGSIYDRLPILFGQEPPTYSWPG